MPRVGHNYIYIRCIYGIFGREITKYTVIYGVYIRFWPTLGMPDGHFLRKSFPQVLLEIEQSEHVTPLCVYLQAANGVLSKSCPLKCLEGESATVLG
jgi:hypothetical protein